MYCVLAYLYLLAAFIPDMDPASRETEEADNKPIQETSIQYSSSESQGQRLRQEPAERSIEENT